MKAILTALCVVSIYASADPGTKFDRLGDLFNKAQMPNKADVGEESVWAGSTSFSFTESEVGALFYFHVEKDSIIGEIAKAGIRFEGDKNYFLNLPLPQLEKVISNMASDESLTEIFESTSDNAWEIRVGGTLNGTIFLRESATLEGKPLFLGRLVDTSHPDKPRVTGYSYYYSKRK